MANWSVQNTITTSVNRVKDGIVKLYADVQLLYGKLNAMRTLRNTGTAPSDAIAKEVWVDNNTLKRRTDDNGDWVVLEANPVDGSVSDAKIGNRTINQALASPANTGPLTSLLSWLAGAIVAITGKTYWYTSPDITLAALKTFVDSYQNPSGFTAGTYQLGNYSVNAQGRITAVEALTPGMKNKLINGDFSIWQRGANAIPTTLRARTSNVATITTDRPHGYVVGDTVQITGLTDTVANVTATLTAVTSTTFSFANTGSDVASIADTGGRCLITNRPSFAIAAGGSMYTADRKKINNGTDQPCVVSRQLFTPGQTDVPGEPKYFYRVSFATAPTTGSVYIQEYIESVSALAGKNTTVSYYAKASVADTWYIYYEQYFGSGGSSNVTGQLIGNHSLTTSWTKKTGTTAIPTLSGKTITTNDRLGLILLITPRSAATYDLALMQLEEGSVATPFEQRHPATELALCQRYYEKSLNTDVPPGILSNVLANKGICMYTTRGADMMDRIPILFKTLKRANPTVYPYAMVNVTAGYIGTTAVTYTASAYEGCQGQAFIAPTATVAANAVLYYYWTADAEL